MYVCTSSGNLSDSKRRAAWAREILPTWQNSRSDASDPLPAPLSTPDRAGLYSGRLKAQFVARPASRSSVCTAHFPLESDTSPVVCPQHMRHSSTSYFGYHAPQETRPGEGSHLPLDLRIVLYTRYGGSSCTSNTQSRRRGTW